MTLINIYCKNLGEYLDIEGGLTLMQLAVRLGDRLPFTPVCARVNNKTENLSFPIFAPKQVEFLDAASPSGQRVVIRTLCMMLYKAVTISAPGLSLRIEHSISRGYLCRLFSRDGILHRPDDSLVEAIRDAMRRLADANLPLVHHEALTRDVIEIFRRQQLNSKVSLLESIHQLYTTYYDLDSTADSFYGPLAPSTGMCRLFDLIPYKDGMLLLCPDPKDPTKVSRPVPQEKMYRAFTEYLAFNQVIKVRNVGQLNEAVAAGRAADLINAAEAMHEKYIGRIAADIARRNSEGGARVVLIAGPSSSGKTTTCKRLAIHLMTNLKTPKMISLDDYFVNRDDSPLDENGEYDFESLYALDLNRLNDDLRRLLAGEEINLPTYSFELGRRIDRPRPLRLDDDDVLLIEGIHGLNPELTRELDPDRVFKVYVSALTSLSIDNHNWISTTDNRLLRRIVRDHKYRNTSALDTIRRWPGVRRGEEKWIFPYQENADATFNSSLIFELGVMKEYAEPLLHEVPHDMPEYAEAYRLIRFLSNFRSIPSEQIPATSLLREFLGGSSFHY